MCCQLDEVIGFARNHNCSTMDDDLPDSCDIYDQPSVTGANCVNSLMKWLDLEDGAAQCRLLTCVGLYALNTAVQVLEICSCDRLNETEQAFSCLTRKDLGPHEAVQLLDTGCFVHLEYNCTDTCCFFKYFFFIM